MVAVSCLTATLILCGLELSLEPCHHTAREGPTEEASATQAKEKSFSDLEGLNHLFQLIANVSVLG